MKYLLLVLSAFFLLTVTNQSIAQETSTPEPTLMVVKFHADWYSSCQAMGSVLTEVTLWDNGQLVFALASDVD